MELTISLIKQLKNANFATPDGKTISYKIGDSFHWDPNRLCIFYNPTDELASQLLLHELGHALLGHADYARDIKLLELERGAWDKAVSVSQDFSTAISESVIEDHLDTYRDWLHARSLCPYCSNTGVQTAQKEYTCASCHNTWHVNEARACGLKRYKTK